MALTAGAEAVSAADGTTAASRSVSAQKRCHSGVAETSSSPTAAVVTSGCDSGASLGAGDRHTHGDAAAAAADAVQHKKMKTHLHLASATTSTATATTTTAAGDSTAASTTVTVTDEAVVASTTPKPETAAAAAAAAGPAAVSVHQALTSLAGWRMERVLRNDASRKMVAVLASVAKRPAEQTGNNNNNSGSSSNNTGDNNGSGSGDNSNNNNNSGSSSSNNTSDNNGSGSGDNSSNNNGSGDSSSSSEEPAVVVLEKQPFDSSTVAQLFGGATSVTQLFCNDIYGGYSATVAPALNPVKMTIIHPATAKHIDKHSDTRMLMVDETPQLYRTALLPCIAEHRFTHEWVYNILEHRSESERIVYEDCDPLTGFVLLPDLKWDPAGGTDSLYLMALVRRRDLASVRDLDHTHLPLLRNIHTAGIDAVVKRYGVHRSDIRAYFHYRPSYYHLHVHITAASFEAPGRHVGRAHLLSTVINNIELMSDYYGRCTMSYFVSQSEHLANHLRQAGYDLAAAKQHSTIDNKATDNTSI